MNIQDINYDHKAISEFGLNIVAALPYVKAAYAYSLEGKLYVRDNPLINRYFLKQIVITSYSIHYTKLYESTYSGYAFLTICMPY